jgi:hypothetical protein
MHHSYIPDRCYFNYLDRQADLRRDWQRIDQMRYSRNDESRYERIQKELHTDPTYLQNLHYSPPLETTYPSVARLMTGASDCYCALGLGLMAGSGVFLGTANGVSADSATKMYIAGSIGMMSGLILVVCAGVLHLNRNTPNRSAFLNCVVRFASIISCNCAEPDQLP